MSGSGIPRPADINADGGSRKGKKKGTFSLFKTALFMIRGPKKNDNQKIKSNEQNEHQVALTENLTKLVGSMRPLHLQDNIDSPTPSLPSLSPSPSLEDLVRSRPSSSSSSSPSWGTMSQYASANNLQELDVPDENDEEEDPDEVFDAITGDDMIDSKAEQFIAQFYQQMKLQNGGSLFDR